ncbi:hypothetical protein BH10PLA2_BH10PLA2_18550 [soil metagenome]
MRPLLAHAPAARLHPSLALTHLVPKLRLGTHSPKLRFASPRPGRIAAHATDIPETNSQPEFRNQKLKSACLAQRYTDLWLTTSCQTPLTRSALPIPAGFLNYAQVSFVDSVGFIDRVKATSAGQTGAENAGKENLSSRSRKLGTARLGKFRVHADTSEHGSYQPVLHKNNSLCRPACIQFKCVPT